MQLLTGTEHIIKTIKIYFIGSTFQTPIKGPQSTVFLLRQALLYLFVLHKRTHTQRNKNSSSYSSE